MQERKKIKKKKYKLKPRFFCIIFSFLIAGVMIYRFSIQLQSDELPNFHGWLAEEVMDFEADHPNISIIYEFVYSDTVRPTRVVSQSLQPGIYIGDEMIVLTIEISKGAIVTN